MFSHLEEQKDRSADAAIQAVKERLLGDQPDSAAPGPSEPPLPAADAGSAASWEFDAKCYRLPLFERKPVWLHVLELRRERPVKRLLVIEQGFESSDQFTLVDGIGTTLSRFAARAGGVDDDQQELYIEFFCACLLAEDGNFVVARGPVDAREPTGFRKATREAREKYLGHGAIAEDGERETKAVNKVNEEIAKLRGKGALALAPSANAGGDKAGQSSEEWKGVLFYGTMAYDVGLTLERRSGMVLMVHDVPIAELGKGVNTGTARRDASGQPPFFVEPAGSDSSETMEPEQAWRRLRDNGLLQDVVVNGNLTLGTEVPARSDALVVERVSIRGDLTLPATLSLSLVLRECVVLGNIVASACRVRGSVTIENVTVWGLEGPAPKGWLRRVVNFEGAHVDGVFAATRLTVRGTLWAPRLKVGSHTDLRGLHVLPPFAIEAERKLRFHPADAGNMANFEQAEFGASVDMGLYVRDAESKDTMQGFRDAVIIGQLVLDQARLEGALWVAGLSVATVSDTRLVDGTRSPLTGFSLWGSRIEGALLCNVSNSVGYGSGVRIPALRLVVGGEMDLTYARLGGALDLRTAYVAGALKLSAIRCDHVAFDGASLDHDALPLLLLRLPMREFIDLPSIQLRPPEPATDTPDWPVATVLGDLTIVNARVPYGIDCKGAQLLGAVSIVGGEIGGIRVQPYVLQCNKYGDEPLWLRPRVGSFTATDLRFTRRIQLFGAAIGPAHVPASGSATTATGTVRPRPSVEINNCFVNGGVHLSDSRIYDDQRSFDDKRWAYHWAGFASRNDLSRRVTSRLASAEAIRTQRGNGGPVSQNEIFDADLLASLFDGNVEIVNCELDGDFDFTNASINGCLKLTDTVVHTDIRAAPFSDEPPLGRWTRAANCAAIDFEAMTCDGDLDLSGCRVGKSLLARRASVVGDLRLTTADAQSVRTFAAEGSVDLTDARCGRLRLPSTQDVKRMKGSWKVEGLAVGAYEVCATAGQGGNEREVVLSLLDKAEFSPQAYVNYERSLANAGRVEDADIVFRAMKEREWGREIGRWSALRLVWERLVHLVRGGLMGYGTRVGYPLWYFLATLALAMWAVWNPQDVQPSTARLAAAEATDRAPSLRDQCAEEWRVVDRFWLALHYAVPVVSIVDASDWDPRESPPTAGTPCAALSAQDPGDLARLKRWASPKNIAQVVAVVNWVLLPWFLLGVTSRIQRRRD